MKQICVYHTRTGNSERIAEKIAEMTGAALLPITDGKARTGFFGYIAAAVVGLKKTLPELLPFETDAPLAEYDRIFLVAPVWCENVSPVMRAFVRANAKEMKGEVVLVLTDMSGLPYTEPAEKMCREAGLSCRALLTLQTHKHDWSGELNDFLGSLGH